MATVPDAPPTAPPPNYRSVNFKERILWALAYKLGADPKKELLLDQASALVSYINAWVRKSWDSVDWPEWTQIAFFTPDPTNHLVPLAYTVSGYPIQQVISRVFKVYLSNPNLFAGPIETPFFIRAGSVHCGFEHGTRVFIKYILQPPEFTAEQWNPAISYQVKQLTYSPITGECYRSLIGSNIGNDPRLTPNVPPPPDPRQLAEQQTPPIPLDVQETQVFEPGSSAVTAQGEIWSEHIGVNTWYGLSGTTYVFLLADSTGINRKVVYQTPSAGMTLTAVMTAIAAAFTGSSDTWINSLTFTQDVPNGLLLIHNATAAFSDTGSNVSSLSGGPVSLQPTETQTFKAAVTQVPAVAQQFVVYLQPGTWIPGSTWNVLITDPTGITHIVSYVSKTTDDTTAVMNGILAGFSADPYLSTLPVTADHVNMTLSIASPKDMIQVAAQFTPSVAAPPWELVAFPFALADIVLQGAYADALREWGQAEKAVVADKAALLEGQNRAAAFLGPTYDRLSDQQQPKPRYMVQIPGGASPGQQQNQQAG